MPGTPILELENVVKRYQAPDGAAATAVLRGITLAIAPGESLAIVGPSGSGKSTLLNIMGTLDRPTSGRMLLEGRDLADATDETLAAVRNRRIGFVFQLHHLLPQCTALENVLVPTLVQPWGTWSRLSHGWTSQPCHMARRESLRKSVRGGCCCASAWPSGSRTGPGNSRAASGSAWPWHGRSSTSPRSCWPMSRRGRSTAPRPRTSPRSWPN
jgi:hypothetical protein